MGNPPGGGSFFEGFLGDLLKMISTQEPVNWELTRQFANGVATEGQPEANVDPLERIRIEELARVADLHVANTTGLTTSTTGAVVGVRAVTRAEWAWQTLDAWRPLLESLARSLHPDRPEQGSALAEDLGPEGADEEMAGMAGIMEKWMSAMGPTLLGLQFGSTVGHLAKRSMGQYDLPVPRPASDELLLVPENSRSFAEDWSLPVDDVRLWVLLSELTHHAVISRTHVRARLDGLLTSYSGGFRPDPRGLESRLSELDPNDPSSIQAALGDPAALLGDMQTPEQRGVLGDLAAVVAAIEGYVDWVVDSAGHQLISSFGSLAEALRRHRVERGADAKFVERLFGLEMGQDTFDRGTAFVRGVIERAGEAGLARLWERDENLPTPAEIQAPGLWLERIDLPGDPG